MLKQKVTSLGTGSETKQAMVFTQEMKRSLLQRPAGTPMSSILDRTLIFDEFEALNDAIPHIKRSAGIAEINVVALSVGENGSFQGKTKHGENVEPMVAVEKTVPGQPSFAFENI